MSARSEREAVYLAENGWSWILEGDSISQVSWHGVVIFESVRPMVRDRDWNTIAPILYSERPHSDANEQGDWIVGEEYRFSGGTATGRLSLSVTQESLNVKYVFRAGNDVLVNRVGITATIPSELAGSDLEYATTRGRVGRSRLPITISPYQPILDISQLDLARSGVKFGISFFGDEFEMEDQRNWCDSSFKIYSRPLSLPFPYVIRGGDEVVQELRLSARDDENPVENPVGGVGADWKLSEEGRPFAIPRISVGATTSFSNAVNALDLEKVSPASLLVEASEGFDLGKILRSAMSEISGTSIPLDVRLSIDSLEGLRDMVDRVLSCGADIRSISVFRKSVHYTDVEVWNCLVDSIGGRNVQLGSGTRGHFAEFNRNYQEFPESSNEYCFSITPEMHVNDKRHINECLNSIRDVVDSVRLLVGRSKLFIGPVTLKPRVNTVATDIVVVDRMTESGYGADCVPGSVDERQFSDWLGAWTAWMLIELALSGVDQVSMFEAGGARGIISESGALSPAGIILRAFSASRGMWIELIDVDVPQWVRVALISDGTRRRCLVINLGVEDFSICLPQFGVNEEVFCRAESFQLIDMSDSVDGMVVSSS